MKIKTIALAAIMFLGCVSQNTFAQSNTPAWHGIEWTTDFCINQVEGDSESDLIANPFNLKKLGSDQAQALANLMCFLQMELIKAIPSETKRVTSKLFTYPHSKVIEAMKEEMNGDRNNWKNAVRVALQMATGCRQFQLKKGKTVCDRRILTKEEAATFATFLEQQFGFGPIQRSIQDYKFRVEESTLSAIVISTYQRTLSRLESVMRKEIELIAGHLKPEIRADWIRQFFSGCKNGPRSNTRKKFGPLFDTDAPLPILFIHAQEYDKASDGSSAFLNALRSVAAGELIHECLR